MRVKRRDYDFWKALSLAENMKLFSVVLKFSFNLMALTIQEIPSQLERAKQEVNKLKRLGDLPHSEEMAQLLKV